MAEDRIKVLTAKVGGDIHNRGILIVNQALRDAGMEVIFIANELPKAIVEAAVQEDVDVIGLSILSATYMEYIPEMTRLMKESNLDDVLLVIGGIILPDEVDGLKKLGVNEFFPPGSSLDKICEYIQQNVHRKKAVC
jgi:methylmalonyl-CoA mutase C-terminal domain/subunit